MTSCESCRSQIHSQLPTRSLATRGTMDVRLEKLTRRFGAVTAVDALDLEIRDGELVALLGPSGCGKTTTLLMTAGIYRPTSGAIYFGERRVDHLLPRDRGIGMVFQNYALYPHMTVEENIGFPLRAAARRPARRAPAPGPGRGRAGEGGRAAGAPTRPSSRAASSSASRWRGRSSRSRTSCCWTSRSRTSTPGSATACAPRSSASSRSSGSLDLRHPRSARSADDGRPDRPDGRRQAGGVRHPGRPVRAARQSLRRRVHRQPADEFPGCRGRPRRRAGRGPKRGRAGAAHGSPRRPPAAQRRRPTR